MKNRLTSKLLALLLLTVMHLTVGAKPVLTTNIAPSDTISTQSEFEALLKNASQRKEVIAFLNKGVYTIEPTQSIYSKFHLSGDGAVIKQKNKILTKKDAIKHTSTHYICPAEIEGIFSLFVDTKGNIIPVAEDVEAGSKVNFTTEDIIPIETQNDSHINKIKIKIPNNLKNLRNKTFDKAFGYIDSWWTSPTFVLTHSDADYFFCDLSLERKKEQFNSYINGEKYAYKDNSAFVLYNIAPQDDKIYYTDKYVYIPNKYDEIEIIDSNSKPLFSISDNAEFEINNIDIINSNLILYAPIKLNGSIVFENCKFRNILKQVLDTANDTNLSSLSINKCEFLDCGLTEFLPLIRIVAPNCVGSITQSRFNQYTGGFCFYKNVMQYIYISRCKEFYITDNVFINNPRGALFLLNGKFEVASNEFFNDSIFNSYPKRNFSRDAGAIYCNKLYGDYIKTKDTPDKINLKFNKIHDFYGKGDVRGIFIDDGRGDITCYGNLIFNGQLYSIDSRVNNSDPYSSIRNKYQYNIVSYPYRLLYGDSVPKADRPTVNSNILLFTEDNKTTTQTTNDIRVKVYDIVGSDVKIENKIVKKLPKDVRKMVTPIK